MGCTNELTLPAPVVSLEESETQLASCQSFIVPNGDVASDGERAAMALAPGSNHRTVFLNFNGGTYAPGANNSTANTSSIPGFTARIVPYEEGAAGRARLLQCVKDQFSRWDIDFTDQDPGASAHIEAVIGGASDQIGMGPIGGISPMHGDCSIVERSVVFVFSRNLAGPQSTCETTAHEVAHSLGLEHEYLCEDPMTYLRGCGDKSFQDRFASCGEYSPHGCMCGGTQNSVQELNAKLGPVTSTPLPVDPVDPVDPVEPGDPADTTAPVVALGQPVDGASLPGNSPLEVSVVASDDDGIAKVELLWQFNGLSVFRCDSLPEGFACRQEGPLFTWTLPVGTGARSFSVKATDQAGNVTTTEVRSITLTNPTQPPVTQPVLPSLSVTGPESGARIAAGGTVQIRAEASGDIGQVWLWWILQNGTEHAYALPPLGGTTWGLDLEISSAALAGPRTLRIAAYDRAGNQKVAPDVSINITR